VARGYCSCRGRQEGLTLGYTELAGMWARQLSVGKYSHAPGDVAQLAEHCLCKAGVRGSIPLVSTKTSHGGAQQAASHLETDIS
jgi:hypothetical protein